jgi:hypothetical protein
MLKLDEYNKACGSDFIPTSYFYYTKKNGETIYFVNCSHCKVSQKLTNSELPAFRRRRFWKIRKWWKELLANFETDGHFTQDNIDIDEDFDSI